MKDLKDLSIVGAFLGLVGLLLVAFVDWRIALGVFLMIFGNDLSQRWG